MKTTTKHSAQPLSGVAGAKRQRAPAEAPARPGQPGAPGLGPRHRAVGIKRSLTVAARKTLPLALTVAARKTLLLGFVLLAGCSANGTLAGYSARGVFDPDIRTVAVPIFDNRTFHREVEFKLTEALTKQIEHQTPYKVTGRAGADTILSGTILSVEQRLLSRGLDGSLAQEVQVVARAAFEWKDMRSGEIIRRRSEVEGVGEFIPTRGVGEPFEVARQAAVEDLARRLVTTMQADW